MRVEKGKRRDTKLLKYKKKNKTKTKKNDHNYISETNKHLYHNKNFI